MGAPGHWTTWGRFPDAVRSGDRQVEAALGEFDNIFDYLADHLVGDPGDPGPAPRIDMNMLVMTVRGITRSAGST